MRGPAEQCVQLYNEAKTLRSPYENDWKTAAAYVYPAHYASWQTQEAPGYSTGSRHVHARRISFDSTGARSLPKYTAVLERIATPDGIKWHGLRASDPYLRQKRRVKIYFEELTRVLFEYRSNPNARFRVAASETYGQLGTYGNGPMFVGRRKPRTSAQRPGFKYLACHLKDIFVLVDDEGETTSVFRRIWLNPRQFKMKFPNDEIPDCMNADADKPTSESSYREFIHYVRWNQDYDPDAIDTRRFAWASDYLCVPDKKYVGEHSGYVSNPYIFAKTASVAGSAYGYSPAIVALSSLGTASAMKRVQLKLGNRAADPTILTPDDNTFNSQVDLRPGAVNPGGVSKDGKPLFQTLGHGNYQVSEAMLQAEQADVEDAFFVRLFQILLDTPEKTATEVVENIAEKAALLGPTMGRLQSDLLGPNIEREIGLLYELGVAPEMPPELVEAQGEYEVVYSSPMAKAAYAEEISGFVRTSQIAGEAAALSQTQDPIDHLNYDVAIPEIADNLAVPVRWLRDQTAVEARRDARQKEQMQAAMLQNAAGLGAAAKSIGDMQRE